jgi:hypothetical protein
MSPEASNGAPIKSSDRWFDFGRRGSFAYFDWYVPAKSEADTMGEGPELLWSREEVEEPQRFDLVRW